MLHLVLYGVLAIVLAGGLFAAAARFLPAGEQIAPPVRDEPPWELPPSGTLSGEDVDAVRLPVALRGYRFAETDLLLDRLAGELRARDAEIARLRGAVPEGPPAGEDDLAQQLPFEEVPRRDAGATGAVPEAGETGVEEPTVEPAPGHEPAVPAEPQQAVEAEPEAEHAASSDEPEPEYAVEAEPAAEHAASADEPEAEHAAPSDDDADGGGRAAPGPATAGAEETPEPDDEHSVGDPAGHWAAAAPPWAVAPAPWVAPSAPAGAVPVAEPPTADDSPNGRPAGAGPGDGRGGRGGAVRRRRRRRG